MDFGDAPSSYGTQLADDGGRHLATGPTLGTNRDSDVDGLSTDLADGDDVDSLSTANTVKDEDGVSQSTATGATAALNAVAGSTNTWSIEVQNAPTGAKLDAWIDWDGSGTFDVNERIANSQTVVNGNNQLTFVAPSENAIVIGSTYARFRISTAGIDSPIGLALDGEVEDYLITTTQFNDLPTLTVPTTALTLAEDTQEVFLLTGVTAGGEDEQLQLTAVSSDPSLFTVGEASLSVSGQAQLALVATSNATGSGEVIVSVRSSGPDQLFDTNDDQLTIATIAVNVTPVNDTPTGYADTLFLALPENAGVQSIQLTDVTAGPLESDSVTMRVTTDKPAMFKSLGITRNVEDATQASLDLETGLNQRGTALVFVTIDDGTLTTTQTITVQVTERNDPPTLNVTPTVVLDAGTTSYALNFSGVGAGADETQTVRVTAFEINTLGTIDVTPTVTYQLGSATGTLTVSFPANSSGNVSLMLVAQDAGPDGVFGNQDDASTSQSVLFALNNAPTLDSIATRSVLLSAGAQSISLTGLADGDAVPTQSLRVTAASSNPSTVDNLVVVYDETVSGTTGQIRFTPVALGSSVVTVNVTDAGYDGEFDTEDDRTTSRQFTVNVADTLSGWHNSAMPLDVNGDGLILPIDVLLVVNELNAQGTGALPSRTTNEPPYLDVNNDGLLQPLDVLLIINAINQRSDAEGELSVQLAQVQQRLTNAVDAVFSDQAVPMYDDYWLPTRSKNAGNACPMDEFFGDD